MKTAKFLLVGTLLLMLFANVNAQIIISPPKISVNAATYNFGTVEVWENQPATFSVTNNTEEIITFLPTYPTEKIQIYNPKNNLLPGESIDIQLFFYTEKDGAFKEVYEIYTSYDDEPLELKIKGQIKKLAVNVLTACPGSLTKKEIAAIQKLNSKVKNNYNNSNSVKDNEMVFIPRKEKVKKEIPEAETTNLDKIFNAIDKKSKNDQVKEAIVNQVVVQEAKVENVTPIKNVETIQTKTNEDLVYEEIELKPLSETNEVVKKPTQTVYKDNVRDRKKIGTKYLVQNEDKLKPKTLFGKRKMNEVLINNSEEPTLINESENENLVLIEETESKEPVFTAVIEDEMMMENCQL